MKDRNTKRVLKHFGYRECDAFAEYLHRQSMEGWHFKGWKMGLIFEKGAPAEVYYDVEVFPKAKDGDIRPAPDTLEYAEYCEAAGWKFLDSNRKVCVFRQMRKDAVPIVTAEERLSNILNAEWKSWLGNYCTALILMANPVLNVMTVSLNYIFSNLMIVVFLLFAAVLISRTIDGLFLVYWSLKKKRELKKGELPAVKVSRLERVVLKTFQSVILILGYLVIGVMGYLEGVPVVTVSIGLTVLVIALTTASMAYFRPDRDSNIGFQIGIAVFAFLLIIMVSAVVVTTEDEITDIAQVPLLQEDYRVMKGKSEVAGSDYQESILGRRYYYWIRYVEEKPSENRDNHNPESTGNHTPESENIVIYDSSSYHIYESWNEKIIDIIWKDRVEDTRWESQDCTEQWNAQIGRYSSDDSGASYEIKYADKILTLHTDVELTQEQIEIIIEKLRLTEPVEGFFLKQE